MLKLHRAQGVTGLYGEWIKLPNQWIFTGNKMWMRLKAQPAVDEMGSVVQYQFRLTVFPSTTFSKVLQREEGMGCRSLSDCQSKEQDRSSSQSKSSSSASCSSKRPSCTITGAEHQRWPSWYQLLPRNHSPPTQRDKFRPASRIAKSCKFFNSTLTQWTENIY